ncbi:gp43 [Streptomyces phage phiSASD1]|uniref:Gp43 n=1 Tax=Streptomyces phage phiSASD1 TaxID=747763 RepID=D7NW69_9CAUD|nr:gp43 [Streptomyces phage phiSASD1]ADE43467.1 gp43 [Streptomyces phage phiSASD1]
MKDIALTGLSRSGKDSVAARLMEAHGYVRVAFADKLKEAALKANPIVLRDDSGDLIRLSEIVNFVGWEHAKDGYPEVRRFLQDYGQTVREIDPYFWIQAATPAVQAARDAGRPIVFTDVRYLNEAETLALWGFEVVRVQRPGQVPGEHRSERELLEYQTDATIVNDDTLSVLAVKADGLTLL